MKKPRRLARFRVLLLCAWVVPCFAREPVRASKGMVVTTEPHATEVGVAVLEAGGNAIDAAVGVGFALAVTHPSAGNLGGGGFLLARFADGRTTFLDFRERAPQKASRKMFLDAGGKPTSASRIGYLAAGVPGTVKGLEYAHRKYGKREWSELLRPSILLATQGFRVPERLARSLLEARERLELFPESRRIFLKDGDYYEPGDRLVQADLARTLERIRTQGAEDFYNGETAMRLAADMGANGGLITRADLRAYTVAERKPLTGAYRDYSIITAPLPSSGGVGILQMLGVLEGTDLAKMGATSVDSMHLRAEAMRRFFADRSEHLGDPDFVRNPVSALLNPKYIAALRGSIDPERATPSSAIRPGKFGTRESTETTHYSIVDAEGNIAAVTYTLNGGYGSGATASGLGFLLNNEMDDFTVKPGEPNLFGLVQGEKNAVQPGKRPLSSMTPTIVMRDGKPHLVLGSPGGPTIINTVLNVMLNVLDFGMNVQDAVDAPRIHHQWLPDELRVERALPRDVTEGLKARGHTLTYVESIGRVAAIAVGPGGLQGAADDTRSDGLAKGH